MEDMKLDERTSLLPLVLSLMTEQAHMLSSLWNQRDLWHRPVYLILLSNFVFETENPAMIRAFLTAEKTKLLFNSVSLAEKRHFLQFVIENLGDLIVNDTESAGAQHLSPLKSVDSEQMAKNRSDLEQVLNIEFLSNAPYSCVNIPVNLLPVGIEASMGDLIDIADQYRQSADSIEVLELSLKNLSGDAVGSEAYAAKWAMINDN